MDRHEYLFKFRVADPHQEVMVYSCYHTSMEEAEQQLRDLLSRRKIEIIEIFYKKAIPQFASRAECNRWWHSHGGNKELA